MDSEKWTIDSREYVLPDFMYNTVTAWLRVVFTFNLQVLHIRMQEKLQCNRK